MHLKLGIIDTYSACINILRIYISCFEFVVFTIKTAWFWFYNECILTSNWFFFIRKPSTQPFPILLRTLSQKISFSLECMGKSIITVPPLPLRMTMPESGVLFLTEGTLPRVVSHLLTFIVTYRSISLPLQEKNYHLFNHNQQTPFLDFSGHMQNMAYTDQSAQGTHSHTVHFV